MKRWRLWVLVGLAIWLLLVTWWALTPMSDSVPTGVAPNHAGAVVPTDQTVQCPAPLSGSTKPTESLPVLRPDSRAYQRTPCVLAHNNARIIFVIDLVVALAVVVVLIKTWKPAVSEVPTAPAA